MQAGLVDLGAVIAGRKEVTHGHPQVGLGVVEYPSQDLSFLREGIFAVTSLDKISYLDR
jgi:hypothetical protein